jgi:hypothetical protein
MLEGLKVTAKNGTWGGIIVAVMGDDFLVLEDGCALSQVSASLVDAVDPDEWRARLSGRPDSPPDVFVILDQAVEILRALPAPCEELATLAAELFDVVRLRAEVRGNFRNENRALRDRGFYSLAIEQAAWATMEVSPESAAFHARKALGCAKMAAEFHAKAGGEK